MKYGPSGEVRRPSFSQFILGQTRNFKYVCSTPVPNKIALLETRIFLITKKLESRFLYYPAGCL